MEKYFCITSLKSLVETLKKIPPDIINKKDYINEFILNISIKAQSFLRNENDYELIENVLKPYLIPISDLDGKIKETTPLSAEFVQQKIIEFYPIFLQIEYNIERCILEKQLEKRTEQLEEHAENLIVAIDQGNIALTKQALGQAFFDQGRKYESQSKKFMLLILTITFTLFAMFLLISNTDSTSFNKNTNISLFGNTNISVSSEPLIYLLSIISSFLPHIPLIMISFWLLWFLTKQYMKADKLKDDYNFKGTFSQVYYGFKTESKVLDNSSALNKEGRECVPERGNELFQRMLFEKVLNTISNPLPDTTKADCNTPYSELLDKLNETMSKVSDVLKSLKDCIPKK